MVLKQFIFLRRDLPHFGKGALVAQACHASVAALHTAHNIPETQEYLLDLQNMHKVVLRMESKDIDGLLAALEDAGIRSYRWIEQPEDICTAIATQPFHLENFPILKEYFLRFKLY